MSSSGFFAYTSEDEAQYRALLETEEFPFPQSGEMTSEDLYREFSTMYRNFPPNFKFSDGKTPLAFWASGDIVFRPQIVKDLLEYGVDPHTDHILDVMIDLVVNDQEEIALSLIDSDEEVEILIDMFANVTKHSSITQTVQERIKTLKTRANDRLGNKLKDGFSRTL